MDWHELDKVVLQSSTERLLDDVRRGLDEVNRLRPLHPNLVESVTADLLADRVYNSNAVEGNPLDLRETRRILEAGHQLTTEKRSRSELEVINLAAAVAFFETQLIPSERPHQAANLLALHAILMKDVDEDAGRFRHKDVMLRGAKYQPPDPSQVEELVKRALGELGSRGASVDPVVAATWIHWAIARVHPFFDGNGRTARLWQDLVLLRAQAACAIIRPEERTRYYQALQTADEGRFDPLVLLVAERVAWTIDRIIFAAAARERMHGWASGLARDVGAPAHGELHLEYLQWLRQFKALVSALVECEQALNRISPDLQVVSWKRSEVEEEVWQLFRWNVMPIDPRIAEISIEFSGQYCGAVSLVASSWIDGSSHFSDANVGYGLVIRVETDHPDFQRQPGVDERAFVPESSGKLRMMELFISSRGIHVLTSRRAMRVDPAQLDEWGHGPVEEESIERFVAPLLVAQRVIQFAVEATQVKRPE